MSETTMTIAVDAELKTAFARAAEERQRTDAEYEQWFRTQVQVGIDAADAGEMIPAEEVEAEFATLRASTQRSLPQTA